MQPSPYANPVIGRPLPPGGPPPPWPPTPAPPARAPGSWIKRHPIAYGVALFGGMGLLAIVILGAIAWAGSGTREWLAQHFAQVRRNPRAFAAAAKGDPERAEAYAAITASKGEDLPLIMSNRGGGGLSEYRSHWCANATLTGPKGERPIGVVVLNHTRDGQERRTIEAISVRRQCKCPRNGGCRLW